MEPTRPSGPAGPVAAPVAEPFPYYLDGPGGELFGVALHHGEGADGAPVVRLVALSLPVRVERGGGDGTSAYAPVTADLAGAEGLVSVQTLRTAYLDADWALRADDGGEGPPAPAARALARALFGLPALSRAVPARP